MVQHAVGQGGLFVGTLKTQGGVFRWAYDCGSNQPDSLAREITRVAVGGPLDLLFLSHLDSDHINGIDRLLAACRVREVVLPYIESEVVIAIVARDAEAGRLNGLFLDAAPDIAAWFAGRGVETVTFIRGGDDGEPPLPSDLPAPPEGGEDREGEISAKWIPPARDIGQVSRQAGGTTMVREVSANAALSLRARGTVLDWALIPHGHTPNAAKRQAFDAVLRAEFGRSPPPGFFTHAMQCPSCRAKLRACYDALWMDHNLVSMTLYSGPLRGDRLYGHVRRSRWRSLLAPGWMLTGDAHLERTRRRDEFAQRYQNVLEHVGTLMLPHHGARANFHPAFLDLFPQLEIGFAAAGPNGYKHPHKDVRRTVNATVCGSFHQVSHRMGTSLAAEVERR